MTFALSDPTLLHTQTFIDGKWVDADSGTGVSRQLIPYGSHKITSVLEPLSEFLRRLLWG